jgi:hypothetical protein
MVADRRRLLPGCVLLLAACVMPSARADDAPAEVAAAQAKPLWEVGLGLGAIAFEDYRGSATTHAYPVPVPYIIYRGEFLQADRDGVRGKLFNQDWLEINVSGNLTTPVRNDSERSGMPELRTTVELGPSFDFHLFKSADQKYKLDLRMPLRVAATVQSSPKWIGGTFTPRLNLDMLDLSSGGRLCRNAVARGPVEALSQVLGRRLHALRPPAGRRVHRQSLGSAPQLLVGGNRLRLDDRSVVTIGKRSGVRMPSDVAHLENPL